MGVRMGIQLEGYKGLIARLNRLPKTAQVEMREAALEISEDEARRIAAAGAADDAQSQAVARFVKARKDRLPAIAAGGARKTGVSGGATAGQLFFGAEFGGGSTKAFTAQTETYKTRSGKERTRTTGFSFAGGKRSTTNQFRPHRGRRGYWFWEQLREDEARMLARWEGALTALEREWGNG